MAKKDSFLEDNSDFLLGVLALTGGYFFVVKPLLANLFPDPKDKAEVDKQSALAPAVNAFNYQSKYAPAIDKKKFPGLIFYKDLKGLWDSGDKGQNNNATSSSIMTTDWARVVSAAENIYVSFHDLFSITNQADLELILSAFNSLANKTDVAGVDGYLQANFGVGLWPLLKNGLPYLPFMNFNNGLNDSQLAQIITIVNALPDK